MVDMTTNPAAVIDEHAYAVRRTIRIAASLEHVWAAVTEPEHISRWFGKASLDGTGAGSRGTLTWPDQAPVPIRVEAFEPMTEVSYRWGNDDASSAAPGPLDEDHSTVFTFTLEEVADGTQLTVVETGFENTSDPAANMESHRGGWDAELDKLVALLEAGS